MSLRAYWDQLERLENGECGPSTIRRRARRRGFLIRTYRSGASAGLLHVLDVNWRVCADHMTWTDVDRWLDAHTEDASEQRPGAGEGA